MRRSRGRSAVCGGRFSSMSPGGGFRMAKRKLRQIATAHAVLRTRPIRSVSEEVEALLRQVRKGDYLAVGILADWLERHQAPLHQKIRKIHRDCEDQLAYWSSEQGFQNLIGSPISPHERRSYWREYGCAQTMLVFGRTRVPPSKLERIRLRESIADNRIERLNSRIAMLTAQIARLETRRNRWVKSRDALGRERRKLEPPSDGKGEDDAPLPD